MHSRLAAACVCAALALACRAGAQAPPPASQPDLPLDAATRRVVLDSLCAEVTRHYVFPDRAQLAVKAIRRRAAAHAYDGITSSAAFADSLTAHLQAAVPDLHLRVHYRYDPIPPATDDGPPPPAELAKAHEQERRRNYGFERAERLPGNVGYLDLRSFSGDPAAQQTAVAAMNWLGNTDALLVDLRRNGGGSPAMIATLLTYFVAEDDRLLFNTFYQREGDRTEEWWTSPYVPGARYTGKPVYVLTSNRTGSAAEEFAYDVQTHKLGTLVGAVTAGGANPGGLFRLNEHFAAFVATGRAINPVTKTNWEGVGVKPDTLTSAGEALRAAHTMALRALIAKAGDDPERAEALRRALADAAARPPDAEADFVKAAPPGEQLAGDIRHKTAEAEASARRRLDSRRLLAETVGAELRVHAGVLPRGELVHARVVRVVHEVGDRVRGRHRCRFRGQVLQLQAAERSAGVSVTRSFCLVQAPWKVW